MIRILFVEDDIRCSDAIKTLLSTASLFEHECTVACDLSQAIEFLTTSMEPFDVILADLNLPDSRGTATIHALHAAAPNIPIIVLTGDGPGRNVSREDRKETLKYIEAGAFAYFNKGCLDAMELMYRIFYAMEWKRQHKKQRQECIKAAIRQALVDLSSLEGAACGNYG